MTILRNVFLAIAISSLWNTLAITGPLLGVADPSSVLDSACNFFYPRNDLIGPALPNLSSTAPAAAPPNPAEPPFLSKEDPPIISGPEKAPRMLPWACTNTTPIAQVTVTILLGMIAFVLFDSPRKLLWVAFGSFVLMVPSAMLWSMKFDPDVEQVVRFAAIPCIFIVGGLTMKIFSNYGVLALRRFVFRS